MHYENIYFIGDRCEEGGNDYHLYHALKKTNVSYQTKNPKNTIDIISKEILPKIRKEHNNVGT